MRELNEASINQIKQWEAFIPFAYDDFDAPKSRRRIKPGDKINGTLTIGYGHTSAAGGVKVVPGMTVTKEEAETILRHDLERVQRNVESLVKVPLTDNQYGVLTSFDFNTGKLAQSTLLKKLNAGNYAAVPAELMKWVNSKGKRMQGLVNRRAAEAGLWAKGEFVSGSSVDVSKTVPTKDIAVIGTTGAGGIVGTVGPAVPDIVDAVSSQRDELTSGQWARVVVAVVILGLTLWGIYRKLKA